MQRELWKTSPTTDISCPPWICPTCGQHALRLDRKTFQEFATAYSRTSDDFGPEGDVKRFTGALVCSGKDCQERVIVHGSVLQLQEFDPNAGEVWSSGLVFEGVHPAPSMIVIPTKCPVPVREALASAFELFWADPESCANKIRVAVERVMNDLKIKRYVVDKNKKKKEVSLHGRIDHHFRTRFPDLADHLLATKWLGNTGSHGATIDRRDCLDALGLLELGLAEIYDKRSERVKAMVKEINKRKGPRTRREEVF